MNPRVELSPAEVEYPESDGEPMGENSRQVEWIIRLFEGLDVQFRHDPNVLVAGDLFWYPVEGDNRTRTAPDVMVIFGRPKGPRRSYLQWKEGGIAPQVVIEIHSPGNTAAVWHTRFDFYQRFGVEECYLLDPEPPASLQGWRRRGARLVSIRKMNGWTSPRLGIRFGLVEGELQVSGTDDKPFRLSREKADELEALAQRAAQADRERAVRQALAAKLRELGIDPDSIAPES